MRENNLLADLFHAYYDARKNKRNTINQLRFEMDLETRLYDLHRQIQDRRYEPKPSLAFIVFKPVQREVFAADFSDRVVHHLYFNYVNPIFEHIYIEDCYSCRKGRGTHYGVKRLEHHIRSCSDNYTRPCFVLKLDLQGYFMSIDKSILYGIVKSTLEKYADRCDTDGKKWKDKLDYDLIMYLTEVIIFNDPTKNYHMKGSREDWVGLPPDKSLFHSGEGCGLPIGNLTSQLFSNIYLSGFDHYVKRELKFKHYGRYVDDFYIVDTSKERLKAAILEIGAYLRDELRIRLHPKKIYLQPYENGVLFTGGYVKPYRTYVSNRTKSNMKKRLEEQKMKEQPDLKGLRNSINSYLGIMRHYKSFHIRREIMVHHAWVFKYGYVRNCCSVYKLNKSCSVPPADIKMCRLENDLN
jgi:retron-type reverse transcriptase